MFIGHSSQWEFLKKSFKSDNLAHAYLFSGREYLGKKTVALEFLKLIECEKKDYKTPCQQCVSCQQIEKKIHPDFLFINPEEQEIQISQIRALSRRFSLKPNFGQRKIAIIDQAHTMNTQAQTALLKTLEEPRGQAILILVTEHPESLLSTILSRVQQVKFYPLKEIEVDNFFKTQKISSEKVLEVKDYAFGRPGRMINALNEPEKVENQKKLISNMEKLLKADLAERFSYVEKLTKEEADLKEVLGVWEKMLAALSAGSKEQLEKFKKITKKTQETISLILTTNANPRLALEILMVEL